MINTQSLLPKIITIVNDTPTSKECDITKRYRMGYDRLRNLGLDVVFLIENDDWYAVNYFEKMLFYWDHYNRNDIFGTNYTIYYHLKLKAWHKMLHDDRASAMNTLIKADLNFNWGNDNDPYTDMHLWKTLKGQTFEAPEIISIGMKHGIGKCGGAFHIDRLQRYINKDEDMLWLKRKIDQNSFDFYSQIKF